MQIAIWENPAAQSETTRIWIDRRLTAIFIHFNITQPTVIVAKFQSVYSRIISDLWD